MKANVDFPKRVKNSFIYFQVGLIATMLVVLFILEFNFKDVSKPFSHVPDTGIYSEPIFVYNPAPVTKQEVSKPVIVKVTRVTDVFKPTKEEPKKDDTSVKVAPQENPDNQNNNSNTIPTEDPKDNGDGKEELPKEFTPYSVDNLPMFEACKGLSRVDQKACFDEQMAKAISKYLVYPDNDLEKGRQGVALVEFVIDEKGMITNVKALDNKRATIDMQKAAERAVRKIPKLIPATHADKPVKIKYSIPVGFRMK